MLALAAARSTAVPGLRLEAEAQGRAGWASLAGGFGGHATAAQQHREEGRWPLAAHCQAVFGI